VAKAKKVHILSGIRSEYDILSPVIGAISETPGLEPGVIVTGAVSYTHLRAHET
jgi:GDP/UDP-N,N'-diacetylbacillosamine 2-epimerase (hydrolysing)